MDIGIETVDNVARFMLKSSKHLEVYVSRFVDSHPLHRGNRSTRDFAAVHLAFPIPNTSEQCAQFPSKVSIVSVEGITLQQSKKGVITIYCRQTFSNQITYLFISKMVFDPFVHSVVDGDV